MALYNKYRPQTFTDIVGQKHITDILKQAAKENHFVHAYLLVGPRGTGKTTTARIIAQSADGSLRDAINIFDQVITDNEVTEHHVEEALGLVRMVVIEKFIDFLLEKKTYKAIELIE